MGLEQHLSEEHIEKYALLAKEEDKIALIDKIGGFADDGTVMQEMTPIITQLAKDITQSVRHSLMQQLKTSPFLSREVAFQLAQDIEEISVPVLEHSSVFTEEDLIELVRATDQSCKQMAIARRQDVTEHVSQALIDHALEDEVVETLLRNEQAEVTDEQLSDIGERYADNETVASSLACRHSVPIHILQKLVESANETMSKRLNALIEDKYQVDTIDIQHVVQQGFHLSTIEILNSRRAPADARSLADNLKETNKIDANLLLSAICCGKYYFSVFLISRITDIPSLDIEIALDKQSPDSAFRAIMETSDELPASFYVDFFHILKAAKQENQREINSRKFMMWLFEDINDNPQNYPYHGYLMSLLKSHPYLKEFWQPQVIRHEG